MYDNVPWWLYCAVEKWPLIKSWNSSDYSPNTFQNSQSMYNDINVMYLQKQIKLFFTQIGWWDIIQSIESGDMSFIQTISTCNIISRNRSHEMLYELIQDVTM